MSEPIKTQNAATMAAEHTEPTSTTSQPNWETPTMQDVSEEVMAQPYIRFT